MGSFSQKLDPTAARGDCASVSLLTTFVSEFRAVGKSFGQLLANGSQQHGRRHAIEPPRFLNRAVARSRRQILFGFSERSLAASSFGSALLSLQENNTFSRQMWLHFVQTMISSQKQSLPPRKWPRKFSSHPFLHCGHLLHLKLRRNAWYVALWRMSLQSSLVPKHGGNSSTKQVKTKPCKHSVHMVSPKV